MATGHEDDLTRIRQVACDGSDGTNPVIEVNADKTLTIHWEKSLLLAR